MKLVIRNNIATGIYWIVISTILVIQQWNKDQIFLILFLIFLALWSLALIFEILRPLLVYNNGKLCFRSTKSFFRRECFQIKDVVSVKEIYDDTEVAEFVKMTKIKKPSFLFTMKSGHEAAFTPEIPNNKELDKFRNFFKRIPDLPDMQKIAEVTI